MARLSPLVVVLAVLAMTAVLHQEDGDWKIVQTHASIGVPNDRMFDPMLQPGGAV